MGHKKDLRAKIKAYRAAHGLTQADFAKKIKIKYSTYQKKEQNADFTETELYLIYKLLGIKN